MRVGQAATQSMPDKQQQQEKQHNLPRDKSKYWAAPSADAPLLKAADEPLVLDSRVPLLWGLPLKLLIVPQEHLRACVARVSGRW